MRSIIAAVMLSMIPVASYADGPSSSYALITAVHPVYRDNYVSVTETICRDVEVPVYERRRSSSTGDVLAGAIIGGAIGNQLGSGSGRDAMTALGAIVGASVADRSVDVFVGYRVERRCDRVYSRVNDPVMTHYRIQYTYNGYTHFQDTTQRYTLGQRVYIQPSLR